MKTVKYESSSSLALIASATTMKTMFLFVTFLFSGFNLIYDVSAFSSSSLSGRCSTSSSTSAASAKGYATSGTTTASIINVRRREAGGVDSSIALSSSVSSSSSVSPVNNNIDRPTELPDSLVDAAERAANACYEFSKYNEGVDEIRCRIDFDTSAGDETFPILKTSTEFMQHLVSFLTYRYVPGLMEQKQKEVQRVAEARVMLQQISQKEQEKEPVDIEQKRNYMSILENRGKIITDKAEEEEYDGPIVRVYFPDEGNAALATRDWTASNTGIDIPDCVRFNACGSVRATYQDTSKDVLVFFFCPKASESESVEEIIRKTELDHSSNNSTTSQLMTVLVNPNLVDMGVTGFGMAGRMLRERLLDGLTGTYYLRTLQWGALTRRWPNSYTLWEEDENSNGGYKLLRTLPYLPSNPEVEDIYDEMNEGKIQVDENGNIINPKGPSILDQFGDFVNGMMKL